MKGLLVLAAVLASVVAVPPRVRSPKPQLDGRIIGGQAINISEIPYQLSFLVWGSHICGASLISTSWVVTAGHCAEAALGTAITFRGGSNLHASGGQVVGVSYGIIHPSYDPYDIDYDIALYQLSGSFNIGATINIIALPYLNQNWAAGVSSLVSGWGTLYEGGSLSPNLQAVSVPIVSLAQCRAAYGFSAVTDRMLCAGVPQGGLDACQGDSGGPLVVSNVLAGLVSWGYGCARPSFPGVYAHVGALRSFIAERTGI